MKNPKNLKYLFIMLCIAIFTHNICGQSRQTTYIRATANTHSPTLYSDKINIQFLLVNLPGVNISGSYFEGVYQIYFIPEGEIERLAQKKGGVIDELNGKELENKTLLSSGNFRKTVLSKDRSFERIGIKFKEKVPDKLRTMLGKVVIFYSIKIYDAKLKKTIYKKSSFTYFPFERNDVNNPRRILHVSFIVNENGSFYTSSLPRDKSNTNW